MNASDFPFTLRDRLGSLGAVLAAHVLLAIAISYVIRVPAPQAPEHDLIVTVLTDVKPPAADMPLTKHLRSLTSPPSLLVPPPVEIYIQAATAAPVQAPPALPTTSNEPAGPPHTAPIDRNRDDSGPTADASAVGNTKPVYPHISRALGEQGRVLLDVYVLADGSVGDIRLQQSSGFGRLDESALKAVRQWHFKPARQAGKPIAMWYVQPITFDLHNA